MSKNFNEKLADAIRDVGQELIDRADEIAATPLLSDMVITINFDPEYDMFCPTMRIEKEVIVKRAHDRFINPDQKEEI